MRVKMLTSIAGLTFVHHQGDVIDLPERDARVLVARGSAEPVCPVETAALVTPEVAASRSKRSKRALFGRVMP